MIISTARARYQEGSVPSRNNTKASPRMPRDLDRIARLNVFANVNRNTNVSNVNSMNEYASSTMTVKRSIEIHK